MQSRTPVPTGTDPEEEHELEISLGEALVRALESKRRWKGACLEGRRARDELLELLNDARTVAREYDADRKLHIRERDRARAALIPQDELERRLRAEVAEAAVEAIDEVIGEYSGRGIPLLLKGLNEARQAVARVLGPISPAGEGINGTVDVIEPPPAPTAGEDIPF